MKKQKKNNQRPCNHDYYMLIHSLTDPNAELKENIIIEREELGCEMCHSTEKLCISMILCPTCKISIFKGTSFYDTYIYIYI